MHRVSIAALRSGASSTSRAICARQYGSRNEFAIAVACHVPNGDASSPFALVSARALGVWLWHRAQVGDARKGCGASGWSTCGPEARGRGDDGAACGAGVSGDALQAGASTLSAANSATPTAATVTGKMDRTSDIAEA